MGKHASILLTHSLPLSLLPSRPTHPSSSPYVPRSHRYVYIALALNATYSLALFSLLQFYMGTRELLAVRDALGVLVAEVFGEGTL
jgi:hypothetical protein